MSTTHTLEDIQYILDGTLFSLVFIVIIWKKKAIASNYHYVETNFIHWSEKKHKNPNEAYGKSIETLYRIILPCLMIMGLTIFGPLIAVINDAGKVPLNDRSHFFLLWPKVSYINVYKCTYFRILLCNDST